MGAKAEQIDRALFHKLNWYGARTKEFKRNLARRERRRFKKDPDCAPHYNRYDGWVL